MALFKYLKRETATVLDKTGSVPAPSYLHTRGISVPPVQYIYIRIARVGGCQVVVAHLLHKPDVPPQNIYLVSKFLNVG